MSVINFLGSLMLLQVIYLLACNMQQDRMVEIEQTTMESQRIFAEQIPNIPNNKSFINSNKLEQSTDETAMYH